MPYLTLTEAELDIVREALELLWLRGGSERQQTQVEAVLRHVEYLKRG